jgi:(p)ppGpp synthase/HD superfamily hydrolase
LAKRNVSGSEFLESLKIDFFKDRIFVLTPKGDVFDLPEGATPIDFAYAIHSEIGDCASGAKVNGILKSLSFALSSGDIVEILTQKNKKPNREWLSFVKTQNAQSRVRRYFKLPSSAGASRISKQKNVVLKVEDRIGLLKDVSLAFSRLKINIQDLKGGASTAACPEIVVAFTPRDSLQLNQLKLKLKNIKGVEEIKVL